MAFIRTDGASESIAALGPFRPARPSEYPETQSLCHGVPAVFRRLKKPVIPRPVEHDDLAHQPPAEPPIDPCQRSRRPGPVQTGADQRHYGKAGPLVEQIIVRAVEEVFGQPGHIANVLGCQQDQAIAGHHIRDPGLLRREDAESNLWHLFHPPDNGSLHCLGVWRGRVGQTQQGFGHDHPHADTPRRQQGLGKDPPRSISKLTNPVERSEMKVLLLIAVFLVLLLVGVWIVARVLIAGLPSEPLGTFAEVRGETIHYVDEGQGSAIVLVHGASGNLGDMELRLAPALRAAGHRVITIDRPGLGLSSRNDPTLNEITAQADLIVALLDELGVQAPTMVGHSLGGAVSLAMAVNHPERVGQLVDISGVSHSWGGEVWWAFGLAGIPGVGWYFTNALMPIVGLALFEPSVDGTFYPEPALPGYSEKTQTKMVMRPQTFANNAADVRALDQGVAGLNAGYASLTRPFDVVFGTEDYVSPELHAAGLERDAPGAKITLIEGAGHMIHHTQFETVRDIILGAAARNNE